MFVVSSVTNHIFRLLDLAIEVLTLKMTLIIKTIPELFSQNHIKHIYYTSCYLCLLKIIFCIPLAMELIFFIPLAMELTL